MPTPVIPDYRGPNISGVVPGILLQPPGSRPGWFPDPLQDARRTVLLLIDGLGWHQLRERSELAPHLSAMTGGPILTVAPSTTASALTSLTTGAAPIEHGIVGYRMDMGRGEIMNSLRWHSGSRDLRPVHRPADVQPIPPFAGRRVPVVSRAELEGTGFTDSHLRGAIARGWRTVSGIAAQVQALLAEGETFIYAYYDGVDKVAHEHGFGAFYDLELGFADQLVGSLLSVMPPDTTLCVTADHGQVEVGDRVVRLDPTVSELVTHQTGEGRFRWLHCRPEVRPTLLAECSRLYGDIAWVVDRDRMLDEGWLGRLAGGSREQDVVRRLGDVAIVPYEPVSFFDPLDSGPYELVCRHGSLTEQEMRVPLLAHTV